MRVLILAAALIATPAVAAPQAVPSRAETAVRAMQDPLAQELAAGVLDQLVGIVLDTRVGPTAALTDPDVRPDATLRDLARRDDPDFERRLKANTRRAVGTAATVAGGAVTQAAELQRTARRLQAALEPLMGVLAATSRDVN